MKRLIWILLGATACSSGEDATVRLDLTDLMARAAQNEFQNAELVVTGQGMDPVVEPLDPAALTFELDIPSGRDRRFAVEAYNPGDPERLTVYWGYEDADLPGGGTVDLSITVASAGRLFGTVSLSDEAPIPSSVEVTFDYFYDPDNLASVVPGPFTTTARDGAFSVPLPQGEHEITVGPLSVGGITYEQLEPDFWYVVSGEPSGPVHLMLDPVCTVGGTIECCSDNDCVDEVCNLTTHQCEPTCVVGGAIECCSTADCDGSDICNTDTNLCEAVVQQVLVSVFDPTGVAYPDGVTVMVHDDTGAYLRETVTDTSGMATVDAAANNMVSVLYIYDDGYMNYYVLTIAGVQPGDTLEYKLPGYSGGQATQVGDATIQRGSPPAVVNTQYIAVPGSGWYYQVDPVGAGGPYTTLLYNYQVGDDGNLDFLGWAIDDKAIALDAFAVHTGITPGAGIAFTLGESPGYWDSSPLSIDFAFSNMPLQASTYMNPSRHGVEFRLGNQFIDVASGSGAYQVPGNFFDAIEIGIDVGPSVNQQRTVWNFINDTWPAPINYNFATDPLPPIDETPTPPAIDFVNPARPAIQWTSSVQTSDIDVTYARMSIDDFSGSYFYWWVIAPPQSDGPLTVPDLAAAPTGFHPLNYQGGYPYMELTLLDSSLHVDYGAFRNDVGVQDMEKLTWPRDQTWTMRSASATTID